MQKYSKWTKIIRHPSRVLVIGASGSGKSATGHRLAEILNEVCDLPIYVYGVEARKQSLYPPGVHHIGRGDPLPEDAVLLIDEAGEESPARRSMREENIELANLAYRARHKRLTVVFVTQAASELDKNLVESAEVIVVKKPRHYQSETDRRHLRPLLREAEDAFNQLDSSEDFRGWAYVEYPGGREMLEIGVASFWTEELSHILSNSVHKVVHPRRLPKEKKLEIARDLRDRGFTYKQIGKELKVCKTTAWNYLNPRKTAERSKERDDVSERIKRIGGEDLTLRLPKTLQNSLLRYSNTLTEEWGTPLYRDKDGKVLIGDIGTISRILSSTLTGQLAGLAASRRLSREELSKWLKSCAEGITWAGTKLELLVTRNVLRMRLWPEGCRWYNQVLLQTKGKPGRLDVVAKRRPTIEILTPKSLKITADGVEEYEDTPIKVRCLFHGENCWLNEELETSPPAYEVPLPKEEADKVPEGYRLETVDRGRHIQFTVFHDNDKFPITVSAKLSSIEDTLQNMGYPEEISPQILDYNLGMETNHFLHRLEKQNGLESIRALPNDPYVESRAEWWETKEGGVLKEEFLPEFLGTVNLGKVVGLGERICTA